MVKFYPRVHPIGGEESLSSIYINDSGTWREVESWSNIKIIKKLNQISEFEVNLYDIESVEKIYIKEQSTILFFVGTNLLLKGRINRVKYSTAYDCQILGNGMESLLLEKEYENSIRNSTEPKRIDYLDVSAQTIVKEILSQNSDAASPWLINPTSDGLFATDYGNLSVKYEYANRLNCLASLADAIGYEWWISHSSDYNTNYFNIDTVKGSTTSIRTFEVSGANQNAIGTEKETDMDNIINKVEVLGYGDGVNQLRTSTYNASATNTTISADINSTDTTISLTDASSFDSSGTVRIAEEQITYSGKSSNDLTGCSRGANSTTARIHKKGNYIEKYIIYTSAEAGSSIGDNGLIDKSYIDRTLQDLPTAELVDSKILLEKKDPIKRIKVIPDEAIDTLENVVLGDVVTVNDTEADISSTEYRIVGFTFSDEYGNYDVELELSNKSLEFMDQVTDIKDKEENISKYMQGSTNIYQVMLAENCDTNYNLDLRFYISNDVIKINKINLNYQIKPYRIYFSTTASESSHTHGMPSTGVSGATSDTTNITEPEIESILIFDEGDTVDTSSTNVGLIVDNPSSVYGNYNGCMVMVDIHNRSGSDDTFQYDLFNDTKSTTLVNNESEFLPNAQAFSNTYFFNSALVAEGDDIQLVVEDGICGTAAGQVMEGSVRLKCQAISTHSHSISGQTTSATTSDAGASHNHGVNYGISETASACSDIAVYIETSDGGGFTDCTASLESQYGTLSTSSEADIDLVNYSGVTFTKGNWVTVSIRPTGKCRIEGSLYNQVFIESK